MSKFVSTLSAMHACTLILCRHKVLALFLLLILMVTAIAADFLLPSEVDLTILLALPLMLVTACCGTKVGLAAGWTVVAVAEGANRLRWGDGVPWVVTPLNIAIWGGLATALVLVIAAAMQAQRLREAELQLRTLHQTMVTVQDIVRNRLQLVTVVCDLLDAGVMPPARYSERLRAGALEMLALLNQMGQAETVTLYELSDGVHAVSITPKQQSGVVPD